MKRIILAVIIIAVLLTGLVAGFFISNAATNYWTSTIDFTIINQPLFLEVYGDSALTSEVGPVHYGQVHRGDSFTLDFWVKNTSPDESGVISMGVSDNLNAILTHTFTPASITILPSSMQKISWYFTIKAGTPNGDISGDIFLVVQ